MIVLRGLIATTFLAGLAVFSVATGHEGATNVLSAFVVLNTIVWALANNDAAALVAAQGKPWPIWALRYTWLCTAVRAVAIFYVGWWGLSLFVVVGAFLAASAQARVQVIRNEMAAASGGNAQP